jgi:hypothetical protein
MAPHPEGAPPTRVGTLETADRGRSQPADHLAPTGRVHLNARNHGPTARDWRLTRERSSGTAMMRYLRAVRPWTLSGARDMPSDLLVPNETAKGAHGAVHGPT